MCLVLDLILFIGQLSLLRFWCKFLCLHVCACVCSHRWTRWSPAPPTWTSFYAVCQKLPSSKPSYASSFCTVMTAILSSTHFSHASAAIQGYKIYVCLCGCALTWTQWAVYLLTFYYGFTTEHSFPPILENCWVFHNCKTPRKISEKVESVIFSWNIWLELQ